MDAGIVIVAVGNELRGDDGAGILFGTLIRAAVPWPVIDGGDAPENAVSRIAACRPDIVIVADAMDFGGAAGDMMLVRGGDIAGGGVSTHGTSALFTKYLERTTSAKVYLLGFQPERTGLCEPMSAAVKGSVARVADALAGARKRADVLRTIRAAARKGGAS